MRGRGLIDRHVSVSGGITPHTNERTTFIVHDSVPGNPTDGDKDCEAVEQSRKNYSPAIIWFELDSAAFVRHLYISFRLRGGHDSEF